MFLFDEDEAGEAWLVDKPQGWPPSGELWRHTSLDAEGRHSAHLPPPPALERDRSLDVAAWAPVLDCMSPRLGASLSRQASTAFSPPNSGTLPAPEWGAWLWQPGHPHARHRLQPALPASLAAAAVVGAGGSSDSAADTTCGGGAPLMLMTALDGPDVDEEVQQAAQQAAQRPALHPAALQHSARAVPVAQLPAAAMQAPALQPQQPHVAMQPPQQQQPQPHGNPHLHYAHLQLQQAHAVLQLQEAHTQLQQLQRAQAQVQLHRAHTQLQQLQQLQQMEAAAAAQRQRQLEQQAMPPPAPVVMPLSHPTAATVPRPEQLLQQQHHQPPLGLGPAALLPPLRLQQQPVVSPPPYADLHQQQLMAMGALPLPGLAATPAAAPPPPTMAPPPKPRAAPGVGRNGFPPGSLAWGKISQYPWWPAIVLSPDDPSIPANCKPSANQRVCVKFLGPGSETLWMDTRNLIPWGAPAAADKPTRSKAAAFLTALSEAREYASTLEAEGDDGHVASPSATAAVMGGGAELQQMPPKAVQRKPKVPKGPRSPIKAAPGAAVCAAGAGAKRVRVKPAARARAPGSVSCPPAAAAPDPMPAD